MPGQPDGPEGTSGRRKPDAWPPEEPEEEQRTAQAEAQPTAIDGGRDARRKLRESADGKPETRSATLRDCQRWKRQRLRSLAFSFLGSSRVPPPLPLFLRKVFRRLDLRVDLWMQEPVIRAKSSEQRGRVHRGFGSDLGLLEGGAEYNRDSAGFDCPSTPSRKIQNTRTQTQTAMLP